MGVVDDEEGVAALADWFGGGFAVEGVDSFDEGLGSEGYGVGEEGGSLAE